MNDISIRHAVLSFVSPDMLQYEVMKSPMGWRGATLLWRFLDPSRPCESLQEIYKKETVVVWSTSMGHNGEFLVLTKAWLERLTRDPVRVGV